MFYLCAFVDAHGHTIKRVHGQRERYNFNFYISMCEYFSLLQSGTVEAGTFKTFSIFATKHAYKYGFFCCEKTDGFVTLCAFNDAEDIDTVFGDRYSDLIAIEVGQCLVTDESRWLRIW